MLVQKPELVHGDSMAQFVLRFLAEGKLVVQAVVPGREKEGPIEGYVHQLDWAKGSSCYFFARVVFPGDDGVDDYDGRFGISLDGIVASLHDDR